MNGLAMLPTIRKILYNTDLSKNAGYAFRYAVYLAKKTGAEIHIMHVVEELSNDAKITLQMYMLDAGQRKQMLYGRVDNAKQHLNQRLEDFWSQAKEEDRDVKKQIASVSVCESYPPEAILKKAAEIDCDLIIMGTHEKGLTHTFLGSVAKSVLLRSRVPTLIVPLPDEELRNNPCAWMYLDLMISFRYGLRCEATCKKPL